MAESSDPITLNVRGVSDLVLSKTNKINAGVLQDDEGVTGEPEDELAIDLSDEELIKLADDRVALYAPYEAKISPRQLKNLSYYLGRQQQGLGYVSDDPIAGNLIFEAEETFLPAALSKNPEPVVFADNTPEGNKVSGDVKTMLQYHADQLVLRKKLGQMVRQWSIYFLGVMKHGWDEEISDIKSEVRKIQDFIFDPNGCVDAYGDFDSWLGERITVPASQLVEMFPKHKEYITVMVDGRMGTEVTYTEWWDDKMCFYTFKDVVLDKHKNQFFNYEKKTTDEFDLPISQEPKNHFAKPKKPYTFLSVFSLGEQPHDITGLIEQNIPNQNLISRRTYQIDFNLSRQNNSDLFSENNFTQQTAKQASNGLAKGHPILVPAGGAINEAVVRLPAEGLSDSFFKEQETNKETLRGIFGTQGITAQPPNEDTTARGMILSQQYDNTRIGGGIGDAIEQVADNVFNWWTQLYYVFYDEKHDAAILGQMKAVEYIQLSAQDFDRRLIISVAPDSMKPKDELTEMNQAMELAKMQLIDPQTLFTILNVPNPKETAAQLWLYQTNPQLYGQLNFPELQAQIQQAIAEQPQPQQGGQPPEAGSPAGAPSVPPSNPGTLAAAPASASLSNVPLPQ